MSQEHSHKTEKKKGLFARLFDKLDQLMKTKAESSSSCCCSSKENKEPDKKTCC